MRDGLGSDLRGACACASSPHSVGPLPESPSCPEVGAWENECPVPMRLLGKGLRAPVVQVPRAHRSGSLVPTGAPSSGEGTLRCRSAKPSEELTR